MILSSPKDLLPYKDRLFVYLGKTRGWKPQASVLNCNKPQIWKLLTEQKASTFHYLERKETKEELIYNYEEKRFETFDSNLHTPSW